MHAEVDAVLPTYFSRDEIGQTAEVTREIIGKVQETVGAYEHARIDLQQLIGQVTTSSQQVDYRAGQLAQASEQIGQASTQIARAIEDVARGASEQSQSVTTAMSQMASLRRVVTATVRLSLLRPAPPLTPPRRWPVCAPPSPRLRTVRGPSPKRLSAPPSPPEGAARLWVQRSLSIQSARHAVLRSAEQIQALGQQSTEIGEIRGGHRRHRFADQSAGTQVAAIEAARAGEHGKGFDRRCRRGRRKLAERASNDDEGDHQAHQRHPAAGHRGGSQHASRYPRSGAERDAGCPGA